MATANAHGHNGYARVSCNAKETEPSAEVDRVGPENGAECFVISPRKDQDRNPCGQRRFRRIGGRDRPEGAQNRRRGPKVKHCWMREAGEWPVLADVNTIERGE